MDDASVRDIDRLIDEGLESTISELSTFCAVPSISAQGLHLRDTADLLAGMLAQRGFDTRVMETGGAPVVYAEGGSGDRTLLLYNHYDVQPPDPLDHWDSPPFEPVVRDGKVFARGVADDKGQIMCRLAAIDAILAHAGHLPCRIKFVVEGEEEIGSVNLPHVVKDQSELLAADVCLWEGGGTDFKGQPHMYAGCRGLIYVEFHVKTLAYDGHSGSANLLPNAAWRLLWALSTLKGQDERVRIPGFYDDVLPPSDRDLNLLEEELDPEQERQMQQMMGIDSYIGGRTGLDAARQVFEPTGNIAGFVSGYTAQGTKTIVPAEARAKMDFRLVPNQDPIDIAHKLRHHLDNEGFQDVEFQVLAGESAGRTDPDHPYIRLCMRTAEQVYGKPGKVTPLVWGTGPQHPFLEHLGTPILTAGSGTPHDMIHAPNENMDIDAFVKGARHIARLMCELPAVEVSKLR